MWPFKNAKEEMLRRELEQNRTYIKTHTGVVRKLEDRVAEVRNSLAIAAAEFLMHAETQRREIDKLKAMLAEASKNDSPKDVKTGKFTKKATNV